MSKQLSQAEIDALLHSLRQAQPEADPAGQGSAPWDALGEPLTSALTEAIVEAWRAHGPALSVVRAADAPAAGPASAVCALGHPVAHRIWLFWHGAGASAAAESLVAALGGQQEALPPEPPLPPDVLLLPFVGVTVAGHLSLTIGLEVGALPALRARLLAVTAPGTTAVAGRAVTIEGLEVEASVYVGGGMYRLSSLAALQPGVVLPLATEVGEPAVIAIQGRVIAYGEIMVTADDTLAVRLTRVLLGDEGRRATPVWLEQARREPGADRQRALGLVPPPAAGR